MATVGDILSQFQRECTDYPPDPILALSWLQNRYESVLGKVEWPFLIKEAFVSTTNEISAGNVDVVLNSTTVTESVAQANGWSSAVVGRYFRATGDNEFYKITAYAANGAAADTITLDRAYENNSASTVTYSIAPRFYSLASDVRDVLSMTCVDSPNPLQQVSQQDYDLALPNRSTVSSPPSAWAYAGLDSSGVMQVEFYPIPQEQHGILYHYIQKTPSLADASTTLISNVNSSLLRAGWLSDYWSWRGTRTDAPASAAQYSIKFEQEFALRFNEMLARECYSMPPARIRRGAHYVGHRTFTKFNSANRTIQMP